MKQSFDRNHVKGNLKIGFLGTPNDCSPCGCPNGGACIEIGDEIMCIECPLGYSGHKCDVCSDGYFGDPEGRFGDPKPCQLCECNQNIDTNAIGNCNTTTGECLRCIHNTGGPRCEICLQGNYLVMDNYFRQNLM